jgi:small subunit ribosomal protein S6
MKHYELLSILPGTMTETEAQELAGQIKETIEKNGGESATLTYTGKSRLAYPMKHIRYGYFFVLRFASTEPNVQKIQAKLRLMNHILRNLLQIHDPSKAVELNFNEATSTTVEAEAGTVAPEITEAPIETIPEVVVEEEAPIETPVAETPTTEEVPAPKATKASSKKSKTEISMEEIDQKLDELLEKDV